MKKVIVTEWMSLDGIFDSSSMEQWFNPYHSDSRGKYIQDTIQNCEIMLYGRNTYEMLFPYWSSLKNNEMGVADKLNKAKKFVVSTTMEQANWENSEIIKADVTNKVLELKKQSGGDILVQGSATLVKTLLEAGLVDELKLLVQPHIMGSGSRLFFDASNVSFQLNNIQQLDNGVLALSYEPFDK
jgi:dihydrofolate reductase